MFASLNAYLTAGGPPSDPYFYDVSLLLNGDGTNGAQNNTFLDSSSNAFTITRNGNTTQGTFSPYGNLWGVAFNNSAFLASSSTGVSDFGTGNYTFESWVYITNSSVNNGLYDGRPNGNGAYFTTVILTGNQFVVVANGGIVYTSTASFPSNTWVHLAVCRGGTGSNQTAVFINGTRDGTFTDATSYIDNRQVIGATAYSPYGANPFNGYISNMRFVKGSDVYGYSNLTISVPTSPLTAISGTSLLTCQANRFIDSSPNNIPLSIVNSGLAVQRFSPFNPTSTYSTSVIGGSSNFQSGGSYQLTVPQSTNLDFGSGDFTVEAWVYTTSVGAYYNYVVGKFEYPNKEWFLFYTTTAISFQISTDGANDIIWNTSATVPLNAWCHIAVTRSGSSLYTFLNGVLLSTNTITQTLYTANVISSIGNFPYNGISDTGMRGNISDVRVIKGTALYTTTFTPPTAPLTAVSGTQLLTNFTNAGIPDLAMQNDLETVGNAQVSTSVKKYGTGSIAFDGTGDYLVSNPPSSNLYAFGTGDFTVEFWIYFNSVSGTIVLFDPRNSSETNCPVIYTGGGQIFFYVSQANVISGSFLSASTWYHIALARSGTSTKLFVDGTQVGSTYTDTNNYVCQANRPIIGANGYGAGGGVGSYAFNGYIDDLRITNGYARYTANFTPPTTALPTY